MKNGRDFGRHSSFLLTMPMPAVRRVLSLYVLPFFSGRLLSPHRSVSVLCLFFLSFFSFNPQHQSFSYIHQLMSDDEYTEPDREECTRAVLENCNVSQFGVHHVHMCVCFPGGWLAGREAVVKESPTLGGEGDG